MFYPNPTAGKFTLSFSLFEMNEAAITIRSISGQTVYSLKTGCSAGEQKLEIDLRGIPSGIYFVEIKSGEKTINSKLVLK